MEKKRITLLPHQFNDNDYFLLKFNYDEGLVSIARSLGCRWLVHEEGWAIYRSKENLQSVIRAFSGISIVDTSKIGIKTSEEKYQEAFLDVPQEYSQVLIRKGHNDDVIRIYTSLFREFVNHFSKKRLNEISGKEILGYIDGQIQAKKISGKTLEQLIEAINLYFTDVLKREKIDYDQALERKKDETKSISGKDLKQMLKVTKNVKHKAILSLLHGTELERKQLIALKKKDVDLTRMKIKPNGEENDKPTPVVFDDTTKKVLKKYLELYKPHHWLFEGPRGEKYANSTIKSISRTAFFKAGLDEKIPKKKRDPESETNWGS